MTSFGNKILNGLWRTTIATCFFGTGYFLFSSAYISYQALRTGQKRKEQLIQGEVTPEMDELINKNLKMV
jgi:hypothetical protein